ncbi:cancer/testis antigen 55-like [Perognathus longimembris pacificus]|uniref:cancer/testis antigen 55-like n=1 Tax=Perognathus longimembris pacificus TaxID=214514 RepID=UPI00201A063A|nr:cancer/testis antigen 55-like [Perognathus longimembris pacificus]
MILSTLIKEIHFSLDIVSEGFVPYKRDWVEIEYSKEPGTAKINTHSVKPLNCELVEKICNTSLNNRCGIIDYSIFFTLDSLKCPAEYEPQKHDLVDAVIVESIQVGCTWRAVSITPV